MSQSFTCQTGTYREVVYSPSFFLMKGPLVGLDTRLQLKMIILKLTWLKEETKERKPLYRTNVLLVKEKPTSSTTE